MTGELTRRGEFHTMATASLCLSAVAAATWILVNPSDPTDYPSAWVGFFTVLWPFLLSPLVFLSTVGVPLRSGQRPCEARQLSPPWPCCSHFSARR